MQVVLLERVENLGIIGSIVTVKNGYARNYLLPRKKALRATKENLAYFEAQKTVIEAENLKRKKEAEQVAAKMEGLVLNIIRQAGESGHLFGSVRNSDVAEAACEAGFKLTKTQVRIDTPIKVLGIYTLKITLHPEVIVEVKVNVAQTLEEAEAQLEALTKPAQEEGSKKAKKGGRKGSRSEEAEEEAEAVEAMAEAIEEA